MIVARTPTVDKVPTATKVFVKYNITVPHSAAVERLFSQVGRVGKYRDIFYIFSIFFIFSTSNIFDTYPASLQMTQCNTSV